MLVCCLYLYVNYVFTELDLQYPEQELIHRRLLIVNADISIRTIVRKKIWNSVDFCCSFHVSSTIHMLKFNCQCDNSRVIKSWQQNHVGQREWVCVSPKFFLLMRTQHLSPWECVLHCGAILEAQRQASQQILWLWMLDLVFTASRVVMPVFIVDKSPSPWYFVIVKQVDQDKFILWEKVSWLLFGTTLIYFICRSEKFCNCFLRIEQIR